MTELVQHEMFHVGVRVTLQKGHPTFLFKPYCHWFIKEVAVADPG